MSAVEKRPSFREMLDDQDVQQKLTVATTLALEVYRVLMGAMLILFVPQSCNGEICTLTDNFNRDDGGVTKSAFALNLLTLLSFFVLYNFEVKRENKMINYLNVNPENARDNDAVEEALQNLEPSKKEEIWKLDSHYQKAGYFCMGAFFLNSGISLVVIGQHYLNDKTITVLFTNLLFLSLKINDVFTVVNTEKNIFLSAYLTRKVQYNDIDPDHIDKSNHEELSLDVPAIVDTTQPDRVSPIPEPYTESPSAPLEPSQNV